MTALAWDEVGERQYETGVDRGVLYHPLAGAIPWNGLVSVVENNGQSVNPYYQDGIKYLHQQVYGSFSGKISALTYPDELDWLVGVVEPHPGALVHDQALRSFHLSYRTKIGNDLDPNHGYKIHIVFNVTAAPGDVTNTTLSADASLSPLEWDILSMPIRFPDHKPISHISFDSTRLGPGRMATIEEAIYEAGEPLPSLYDLLAMAA